MRFIAFLVFAGQFIARLERTRGLKTSADTGNPFNQIQTQCDSSHFWSLPGNSLLGSSEPAV